MSIKIGWLRPASSFSKMIQRLVFTIWVRILVLSPIVSTRRRSILHVNAQQQESVAASAGDGDGSILVLGDSWASLTGDFLGQVCGSSNNNNDNDNVIPRRIRNEAKSGSTAAEWASSTSTTSTRLVDLVAKESWDYVWLSVGGNDLLDAKCDATIIPQLAFDILTIIENIVENSMNPNIQILYFGYSIPSEDVCGDERTAIVFQANQEQIPSAIAASLYAEKVTLVDIANDFVTPASTPLSSSIYFADAIHLNELGYFQLFSKEPIQEFFGCHESSSSTAEETPSLSPIETTTAAPIVLPTHTPSSIPESESPVSKNTVVKSSSPAPTILDDNVSLSSSQPPSPSASSTTAIRKDYGTGVSFMSFLLLVVFFY